MVYHLSEPDPDGRTELMLRPLELLERLAALVSPARLHRLRDYGVPAANSPLSVAVASLAWEASARSEHRAAADPVACGGLWRASGHYLWAMLIAGT